MGDMEGLAEEPPPTPKGGGTTPDKESESDESREE